VAEAEGRTSCFNNGKKVEDSEALFWISWRHRWLSSSPTASASKQPAAAVLDGSVQKPLQAAAVPPPEQGSPAPTRK